MLNDLEIFIFPNLLSLLSFASNKAIYGEPLFRGWPVWGQSSCCKLVTEKLSFRVSQRENGR